jgi:cytochrome c1
MPAAPSEAGSPMRKSRTVAVWLVGILVLLAIVAGTSVAYQSWSELQQRRREAIARTGGDPDNGPTLLVKYGCANCHDAPGVSAPAGDIGPDLHQTGRRAFIAGVLPNTASNLIRWIVNPRAIDPQSAMPRTGITPTEARDVAAFLYAQP